jgi:predicted nucleic-acid-binding protein
VEALLNEAAAGALKLVTADLVIAELIWVLESAYALKPSDIAPMIRAILATPGLDVINSAVVARALDHYQGRNIDFVDGYVAATTEKLNITEVYSFDRKHMSRMDNLKRLEP